MKIINKNLWDIFYEFVENIWYKIIPYDYRPKHLYYKYIKNWNKRRVHSKYLGKHGWCDRTELLPHLIFQVLDDFINEECSPEYVDWAASGLTVLVDGVSINVRDEMTAISEWWNNIYKKEYPRQCNEIWNRIHECGGKSEFTPLDKEYNGEKLFEWNMIYPSKEKEEMSDKLMDELYGLEKKMDQDLLSYMHRVVNLREFL